MEVVDIMVGVPETSTDSDEVMMSSEVLELLLLLPQPTHFDEAEP